MKLNENFFTEEATNMDKIRAVYDLDEPMSEDVATKTVEPDVVEEPTEWLFDIRVNSPAYRGAPDPAFDPLQLNPNRYMDEMRPKEYWMDKGFDPNTYVFNYVTQGDFEADDVEDFVEEFYRAVDENIKQHGYKAPLTIILNVKSRDGEANGYYETELYFNRKDNLTEAVAMSIREKINALDKVYEYELIPVDIYENIMELHNASDDDSDDDLGYFATMSSADINAAFIDVKKALRDEINNMLPSEMMARLRNPKFEEVVDKFGLQIDQSFKAVSDDQLEECKYNDNIEDIDF